MITRNLPVDLETRKCASSLLKKIESLLLHLLSGLVCTEKENKKQQK